MSTENLDKVYIDKTRILVLDQSSNCTGFSLVEVDYNKKNAEIISAGPLWFNEKESLGKKLAYLYNAIKNYFFVINNGVSEVITEEFFHPTGPSVKVKGSLVVPKFLGIVQLACGDEFIEIDYKELSAAKWRGILGIKPDRIPLVDKDGKPVLDKRGNQKYKRDYKTPAERYVNSILKVPEKYTSNITGNERETPSDVYDSIAMALAILKSRGITSVTSGKNWDKNHLTQGMI